MKIGKTSGFYVNVYSRHRNVTGSSFLNSVHWPDGRNVRFLVDAGAAQGEDNEKGFNSFFPFNGGKIDFIIVTHDHHDHEGLLPVVVRQGFCGPILTHYATASMMNISLYDSCKISDVYSGQPLYTTNEVERTLDMLVGCTTKRIMKPSKNIRVVFYSNGHLVGAVLTLIVITCPGEDDITLIYTGDYKQHNIFFNVELPPIDVRAMNISTIFCESTYGDIDSTDPMFTKCLETNTANAIKEGKTIIYPAFAKGRCQEILYYIKRWKEKGIIPEETPVHLDGKSAQEVTTRYLYTDVGINPSMRNFIPSKLNFVPRTRNRKAYREEIMEREEPQIIISTGGMASYGPVTSYISRYLSREDAFIHLLGYCSPESQGYKLLNTPFGESLKYAGVETKKYCSVARTAELSGHAQRDQLLSLLRKFPNTKSIVINHGEMETKKKFREYLLEHLNLPEDMISVSNPNIGYRIESNGVTDIFETHIE